MTTAPTIVKVYCDFDWVVRQEFDVYIGHEWKKGPFDFAESKWCNKFRIGVCAEPLVEYEAFVRANMFDQLDELTGKVLGCWCSVGEERHTCHGLVLIKLWKERHVQVAQEDQVVKLPTVDKLTSDDIIRQIFNLPVEPKPAKSRRLYRDQASHPTGLSSIEWPRLDTTPIIYVDESSTSNLAGPMHVAATLLLPGFDVQGIHDSKLLTEHERYYKFHELVACPFLIWHIESVSNVVIDEHGKQNAWRDAVRKCASEVQRLALAKDVRPVSILLDGDQNVSGCCLPLVLEPKADYKYAGVAAASIMAKASRDIWMQRVACNYPEFYDIFHSSGGCHSTPHAQLIQHGKFTDLHRRSFNPLKTYLAKTMHITRT